MIFSKEKQSVNNFTRPAPLAFHLPSPYPAGNGFIGPAITDGVDYVVVAAGVVLKKVLVDLLAGGNSGFSLGGRTGGGFKRVAALVVWLLPFWSHLSFLNANMLYR